MRMGEEGERERERERGMNKRREEGTTLFSEGGCS